MKIKNYSQLAVTRERKLVLQAFEKALEAIDPYEITKKEARKINPREYERIFVVAFGKASVPMAKAVEETLPVFKGIASSPFSAKLKKTKVIVGGHPLSNEKSLKAGKEVLKIVTEACKGDLVLMLISGGGSALAEIPRVSLKALQSATQDLMKNGAGIQELNCVRRHLSEIKGGKLADACKGKIIALVLSDVIENHLDCIASGAAIGDSTTFAEALEIARKYKVRNKEVLRLLEKGARGEIPENPRHVDAENKIIASNETALNAAKRFLESKGIRFKHVYEDFEVNADALGTEFALKLETGGNFIAGGESTVVVKGKGRGGRNQQMALRALEVLSKLNSKENSKGMLIACFGTDRKCVV